MSMPTFYVYYDENYPSSWIGEKSSKKIVEYFTSKHEFKVVNARELRDVMSNAPRHFNEVVILFSQDIIPDTVVDNPKTPTENSLIKRFLNQSHTIVWIGDLPLFYVGLSNREKVSTGEGYRLFYPGLPNPFEAPDNPIIRSQNINITYHGSLLGLTRRWDSWRPAPQNWSPAVPPLQRPVTYHLAQYYTGSGYRSISHIIDYSGSGLRGFIRLYDCKLPDISEELIEQLSRVIFYRNPTGIMRILAGMEVELKKLREELETGLKVTKDDTSRIENYIKEALNILRKKQE